MFYDHTRQTRGRLSKSRAAHRAKRQDATVQYHEIHREAGKQEERGVDASLFGCSSMVRPRVMAISPMTACKRAWPVHRDDFCLDLQTIVCHYKWCPESGSRMTVSLDV
jgi:hypothetical protein